MCINRFLCFLALTARWGVALQSVKSDLRFILRCPQQLSKLRIWPRFRQTTRTSYDRNCLQREARIANTSARKFYGQKPYYAEKCCDERFLDRVINLIPDSRLKSLVIPDTILLSPESYFGLWALSPSTMLRPWHPHQALFWRSWYLSHQYFPLSFQQFHRFWHLLVSCTAPSHLALEIICHCRLQG